ncbi:hypothetical protein, conserved [Eimeria maxima]|uniref:EF-hand domain-containing protein n=1 Tax=Eimeria maxima TaxID=5804 RepID=U6M9K2_EIMMA|nr:hypothetical protein, conserved [Eimeria maxima]CDJ59723.1 hypothetical protein, conserved [Eimeria maxima]
MTATHFCHHNSNLLIQQQQQQQLQQQQQQQLQQQQRFYWAKTEKAAAYDSQQIATWRENFPSLKEFSDEDLLEWRRVFDSFDTDGDGRLSRADLQKRAEFSLDKVQKIEQYDKDKNNLIDFGEFVEALYEASS